MANDFYPHESDLRWLVNYHRGRIKMINTFHKTLQYAYPFLFYYYLIIILFIYIYYYYYYYYYYYEIKLKIDERVIN